MTPALMLFSTILVSALRKAVVDALRSRSLVPYIMRMMLGFLRRSSQRSGVLAGLGQPAAAVGSSMALSRALAAVQPLSALTLYAVNEFDTSHHALPWLGEKIVVPKNVIVLARLL